MPKPKDKLSERITIRLTKPIATSLRLVTLKMGYPSVSAFFQEKAKNAVTEALEAGVIANPEAFQQ